ncbi:diguanylate cyclase (GGDEF)-like protein [Motilibacter peucedani]|uniref:Diguanylate cyclase (GGDEF)-like protein n=1 Tax=Motilibacter peucedani TaxID=598650 RepID=A0A420XLP7_9ACTN|nr:EAL domain-containing protein [Motilibacter peucedani]RKS69358.1 diguanylate cyclase (GGDEF)-like protein [Motilibacter peucedani]
MGGDRWQVAVALQYVLAGFALQLALLFLLWWQRRRADRHVLWLGLWCLSLVPLLISSAVLFDGVDAHADGELLLVRTVSLSVIATLALPAVHGVSRLPVPRRLTWAVAAYYCVRLALWVGTDLVYAHRRGPDGMPDYGPLVAVLGVPPALLVAVVVYQAARRTDDRFQRLTLMVGILVAAACNVASWVLTGEWSELLSSLWCVPLVLLLGLIGLHRVAATQAAEDRLLGRQAAVVALGRSALVNDADAPVETEAAGVLREHLGAESVALRRYAGDEPAADGVPGSRARRSGLHLQIDRETPLDDGEREFVDSVLQVVSASLDREAAEEELRRSALHDHLTGLPNRTLLQDRLERGLARAARGGGQLGVLFCDLDDFKHINDSHGHAAGDELLRAVAGHLTAMARSTDSVARFGGDEFVVVCESVTRLEDLLDVAHRLADAVRGIELPGVRAGQVSVSIGIASSDPQSTPTTLLRDADTAMYRAKERGTGVEVFSEALRSRLLRRTDVESGLARAVEAGEIVTHYQPVFEAETLRLSSVEALVRWRRGNVLLLPGEWIAIAEASGQIVGIGEQVLRTACCDQRELGVPVAVNVSARQLAVPSFLAGVERALAECRPGALVLEITESAVIDDVDHARGVLSQVRSMGVRVAMDDFGTGYSSLSALSRLPIDILKIDQAFVRRLHEEEGRAVVSTIVGLGGALGHDVVAEGVETPEQLDVLRELGCGYVQGFLTGRPVALEQLTGRSAHEPQGGTEPGAGSDVSSEQARNSA